MSMVWARARVAAGSGGVSRGQFLPHFTLTTSGSPIWDNQASAHPMNMTEEYWMPARLSTPSYVSTPADQIGVAGG